MGKEIKVIKKDKVTSESYTFIGDSRGLSAMNTSSSNPTDSAASDKERKVKDDAFKLRNEPKKNLKARAKSRMTGGHSLQGHSPVYE
jgi:hypothetical protein